MFPWSGLNLNDRSLLEVHFCWIFTVHSVCFHSFLIINVNTGRVLCKGLTLHAFSCSNLLLHELCHSMKMFNAKHILPLGHIITVNKSLPSPALTRLNLPFHLPVFLLRGFVFWTLNQTPDDIQNHPLFLTHLQSVWPDFLHAIQCSCLCESNQEL